MAIVLKPRRTATAGKVPTTTDLADGELGLNTTDRKIYVRVGASVVDMLANLAPLNSPALTGTPTAPTAASGTNTTQVATTAFVAAAMAAGGGFSGTYAGEYISTGTVAGYHFKSRDDQAQGNSLYASGGKIRVNGAVAGLWEIDRTTGDFSTIGGITAGKALSVAGGLALLGNLSGLGTSEHVINFAANRWLTFNGTAGIDRFQFGGTGLEAPWFRTNNGGKIYLGSGVCQKLNLWNETYGIGIQNSTMYFRIPNSATDTYCWHFGGVHSDTAADPGTGGLLGMRLSTTYLSIGAKDFFAKDIKADRGDGSGVIYFGANVNGGTRYLYWDNANYQMPGGELYVNGARVRRVNENIGPITDTRYSMPQPNQVIQQGWQWDFKHNSDTGLTGTISREWQAMLSLSPWSTYDAAHPQQQLLFHGWGMAFRWATGGTTWSPWCKVLQSVQTQQIHSMSGDPVTAGYAVHEADLWVIG